MGGKTARVKGDLDDVEAILEIITILKDVSTNKFFTFAQQKADFTKFLQVFLMFFNMLESAETDCPLVRNDNEKTDIVIITSEQSFMSQLNGKVCSAGLREFQKYPEAEVVLIGHRGVEKCEKMGMKLDKVYRDVDALGRYQVALSVRDHVIERMMSGAIGRVVVVYIWAKSFNVLKPRVVRLLPASELLGSEDDDDMAGGSGGGPKFIQESSIDGIMKILADVWVSSRLYEMISDTQLAESAAQAQQLESAMEGLSKEKKGMVMAFKKSQRGDLNKAMREVFTSSSVCKRSRR